MPLGSLAYLALVLTGYAVFILVLAAYWLQQVVHERRLQRDAASVPSPKQAAPQTDHRRAA